MSSRLQPCRACQRRVVDAFTSLAGISLNSPRAPIVSRIYHSSRQSSKPPTQRFLHTSRQLWTQNPPRPSDAPKLDELVADQPDQPNDTPPAHIPWYLQTTLPPPPTTTTSLPSASLTALPPLPPNSPAILSPLLTHLSLSIGLDSLSILDLRDLSPPSALGSNLLMILGTARSEKHLNTSADRFCRWLRTTYKLRPYADGLLGRNELKLKLRRRNKKIKLAQSVGNTVFESQPRDDGITTGWICCNLGAVDGAVIPEVGEGSVESAENQNGEELLHPVYSAKDQERFLEDEDEYRNPSPDSVQEQDFKYAGFGSASYAPRIVVQMFTEEKRAEMDLEGLWEARIRRRDEKDEMRQMKFEERQQMMEVEEEFETGRIEEEIENPDKREGIRQEKVLGGMAAS